MAKKQPTGRVRAAKKRAVVIRMSQTDCTQILTVLKHLQHVKEPVGRKRTRLVAKTQKVVGEPPLFEFIKQVYDRCCMSCPRQGRLIVIDIDPAKKGTDE
jgi:hypothetical protein